MVVGGENKIVAQDECDGVACEQMAIYVEAVGYNLRGAVEELVLLHSKATCGDQKAHHHNNLHRIPVLLLYIVDIHNRHINNEVAWISCIVEVHPENRMGGILNLRIMES